MRLKAVQHGSFLNRWKKQSVSTKTVSPGHWRSFVRVLNESMLHAKSVSWIPPYQGSKPREARYPSRIHARVPRIGPTVRPARQTTAPSNPSRCIKSNNRVNRIWKVLGHLGKAKPKFVQNFDYSEQLIISLNYSKEYNRQVRIMFSDFLPFCNAHFWLRNV